MTDYSEMEWETLCLLRNSMLYNIAAIENKRSKSFLDHIRLFFRRRKFSRLCTEILRRTIRRHTL